MVDGRRWLVASGVAGRADDRLCFASIFMCTIVLSTAWFLSLLFVLIVYI